jgi:hypothetical protein
MAKRVALLVQLLARKSSANLKMAVHFRQSDIENVIQPVNPFAKSTKKLQRIKS